MFLFHQSALSLCGAVLCSAHALCFFLEVIAKALPSCHRETVTSSELRKGALAWCEDMALSKEVFLVTCLIHFAFGMNHHPDTL